MTQQTTTPGGVSDVELAISGMTCASCAARIERKLNKLDGVTAAVNYATEKAKISYPSSVTPDDLVSVVEATGYTATVPTVRRDDEAPSDAERHRDVEAAGWWQRLVVSAVANSNWRFFRPFANAATCSCAIFTLATTFTTDPGAT